MKHHIRGRDGFRPGRLRVGVVSAGRVGSVLGAALARAGHHVEAVVAVSAESRRRAERWLPDARITTPDRVVESCDLVLLSVPDDQLAPLVQGLTRTGSWSRGTIAVHTSGVHGLGVLEPAVQQGVVPLALHPAMSVTARDEDAQRLAGVRFGVTAPEPYRMVAETLTIELGGEPVWVPDHARPAYHAALTMAANHLVTLVNDAVEVLRASGVEDPQALMAPLLSGVLDNSLRLGDQALTGPVSRGDSRTVQGHVEVLSGLAPAVVPGYRAMARRTAARALESGRISEDAAGALLDVLASGEPGPGYEDVVEEGLR